MTLDFRKTKFLTSAANIKQLKDDDCIEIAFAGRSNSGKSSAINTICDNKSLAKTSRTPGRTRLINLFEVADGKFLVDLPGYGYAKVSDSQKRQWQKSMSDYLQKRISLKALVITMDIRHPLKDHDRLILSWATEAGLKVLILLTKSDKLGTNAKNAAIKEVKYLLSEFDGEFNIVPFSSLNKTGVQEVRDILDSLFTQEQ